MELAVEGYALTRNFPLSEQYGLTSQIRRSAASIPANIAEGYGRDRTGAYVNFLRIAQGSLKELETHLLLSERLAFFAAGGADALLLRCDEIGRMLHGLIRAIERGTTK